MTTTAIKTLALDKQELLEAILRGDVLGSGGMYLGIDRDGTTRINWAQTNGHSWKDDYDYAVAIPALYPDGDGIEQQDADEAIARLRGVDFDTTDIDTVEMWKDQYADDHETYLVNALEYALDEFIDDLNDETSIIWITYGHDGAPGYDKPAFEFATA